MQSVTIIKRSASASFPNTSDTELPSPRLSRSVDPQMQAVSCQFFAESQGMPYASDAETERMASYGSVEAGAAEGLHIGSAHHLATGAALLGNAICKVENEDFSCGSAPTGNDLDNANSNTPSDFVLPLGNIFEEPINLSVKKGVPSASQRNATQLRPAPVKELKNEADSNNCFQQLFMSDIKNIENTDRMESKETKIPYVRLERLKICAPGSGELPVFKLQPPTKDEGGSVRLLVKYGAQSKSMSIKVNPDSPNLSPPSPDILPQLILPFRPGSLDQISAPSLSQQPQQSKPLPGFSSCSGESQEPTHSLEAPIGPLDVPTKINVVTPTMKKSTLSEDPDHIENEDFCAVCLNGGEMLCCDHCPKVFHLSCHVPALLSFPVGEWVCTLCRNLTKPEVHYDCDNTRYSHENTVEERTFPVLDVYDQKKCEKLVLSLCCNSLSLPFQEPVSPLARHYYQIIKHPMDLAIIQRKLQKQNIPHYCTPEELVFDIRLMFWNCAKFNYADSEVAEAGRTLQLFFEDLLKEAYPDKFFPFPQEEDSDTEDIDSENCSMTMKEFHWPSYGQECIQPKRRRRHTVSQKAKEFSLC